jgi:acyl-CoA synthetase (AMP-forming)/AMP-acid ligase II
MLLSDVVHHSARKRPDHPALIFGQQCLTYTDLSQRIGRLASALARHISPGDRVAVLADNCVEYFDLLYGAPQAGAIVTLVNQRLTPGEVEQILEDAEPRVLFVGANHAERLGDVGSRVRGLDQVVVLGDGAATDDLQGTVSYAQLVDGVDGTRPIALRAADGDTAWLIYTSGTTGRPKGAMLSHRNVVSAILNALLEWRPTRDERLLFCFPLCHVAAFVPLSYHLRQATVVLMSGFDPGGWLSLVEEHRATHTGLAPTMINMVLEHPAIDVSDTSSVQLIVYGGSPISPSLLERGIERFGCVFCGTFGQTEASGNVLALDPADHRRAAAGEGHLLGAAGRCECLAAVRLVDDDLRDVPLGEVGEIVIRGDQVMQGYWRNDEATRETIVDGWLRTGDLARMDDEGFIYIVDRKKDMIISGGENVFPREVEDVIAALPGVSEVAVIGLTDDRWGELVTAVISPSAGASLEASEVIAHCRAHLAGFKVPKRVEFRDGLPKNAAMKVLKRVLREEQRATAPAA